MFASENYLPDISYKEFLKYEYSELVMLYDTASKNLKARNEELERHSGVHTVSND